jgi:DNA-binding transcriptional MerR regulator
MRMKKSGDKLKIGEVARRAGVSVSTVHYYLQQGLLTPPVKTSRNMAYYDPQTADEIKLIQELQSKKYMPLSAIKLIIKAKREGQDINHIEDMKGFMEDIFQPAENDAAYEEVSLAELTAATALPESVIRELEQMDLIVPVKKEHGITYNYMDILIAQAVKKLTGCGLKLSDLDIFRQQIQSIRQQARALHEAFHNIPDHEQVPLRELLKAVTGLNGYLLTRVLREEASNCHEHDEKERS